MLWVTLALPTTHCVVLHFATPQHLVGNTGVTPQDVGSFAAAARGVPRLRTTPNATPTPESPAQARRRPPLFATAERPNGLQNASLMPHRAERASHLKVARQSTLPLFEVCVRLLIPQTLETVSDLSALCRKLPRRSLPDPHELVFLDHLLSQLAVTFLWRLLSITKPLHTDYFRYTVHTANKKHEGRPHNCHAHSKCRDRQPRFGSPARMLWSAACPHRRRTIAKKREIWITHGTTHIGGLRVLVEHNLFKLPGLLAVNLRVAQEAPRPAGLPADHPDSAAAATPPPTTPPGR